MPPRHIDDRDRPARCPRRMPAAPRIGGQRATGLAARSRRALSGASSMDASRVLVRLGPPGPSGRAAAPRRASGGVAGGPRGSRRPAHQPAPPSGKGSWPRPPPGHRAARVLVPGVEALSAPRLLRTQRPPRIAIIVVGRSAPRPRPAPRPKAVAPAPPAACMLTKSPPHVAHQAAGCAPVAAPIMIGAALIAGSPPVKDPSSAGPPHRPFSDTASVGGFRSKGNARAAWWQQVPRRNPPQPAGKAQPGRRLGSGVVADGNRKLERLARRHGVKRPAAVVKDLDAGGQRRAQRLGRGFLRGHGACGQQKRRDPAPAQHDSPVERASRPACARHEAPDPLRPGASAARRTTAPRPLPQAGGEPAENRLARRQQGGVREAEAGEQVVIGKAFITKARWRARPPG